MQYLCLHSMVSDLRFASGNLYTFVIDHAYIQLYKYIPVKSEG